MMMFAVCCLLLRSLVLLILIGTPSILSATVDDCTTIDVAELAHFLQEKEDNGFHVQGWRWHTLAMRRELYRVGELSKKLARQPSITRDDIEGLQKATEYTVNFNMRGLHRIETQVFFPWVRQRLEGMEREHRTAARSGLRTLSTLEQQQRQIEQLGKTMTQTAHRCMTQQKKNHENILLDRISSDASAACRLVDTMRQQEDSILCPILGRIVSRRDQKTLNTRVLRKLGILESRTHLVSMYEAVRRDDNPEELALFRTTIPSIPQRLIPRWTRTLYEPRIGGLKDIP